MASIVLGQYENGSLDDRGHVTLGVSREDFRVISKIPAAAAPFSGQGGAGTVWIQPVLARTVQYLEKTASGMLRQPVFKGLREDKEPRECTTGRL